MSHFTSIQTSNKLTSPDLLVKALADLGFKDVTAHETPQALADYYQVRGGAARSTQKANVIVPWTSNKTRCSSDFGYLQQGEELLLVADEMDGKRLQNLSAQLQQAYNQHKISAMEAEIIATATKLNKGTPIVERTQVDGKICLKIAYPADIRQQNQQIQQQLRR